MDVKGGGRPCAWRMLANGRGCVRLTSPACARMLRDGDAAGGRGGALAGPRVRRATAGRPTCARRATAGVSLIIQPAAGWLDSHAKTYTGNNTVDSYNNLTKKWAKRKIALNIQALNAGMCSPSVMVYISVAQTTQYELI